MIYIYITCLYCGTVDVFVIQTTIYRGIFVFATFDYQRLCVRGGESPMGPMWPGGDSRWFSVGSLMMSPRVTQD